MNSPIATAVTFRFEWPQKKRPVEFVRGVGVRNGVEHVSASASASVPVSADRSIGVESE
jgi:hypothetical protein